MARQGGWHLHHAVAGPKVEMGAAGLSAAMIAFAWRRTLTRQLE
jgi:hypothetical protein